ncbi:MAG: hypothetical protein ABI389_01590, partial [Rhodanobacter sp.]
MRKTSSVVIGLALLAGLLFGVWEAVAHFFALLSAASPEVAAAVVGGMSTALVAIAAALLAHRSARIRASEDAHRVKKVEIYRGFLEIVARQMANENDKVNTKPLKESELIKFLVTFRSDIILWGSPSVINAFRNFNVQCQTGGVSMFNAVDNLYRSIRRDIGLSNWGLESNALVKMYLSCQVPDDSIAPR